MSRMPRTAAPKSVSGSIRIWFSSASQYQARPGTVTLQVFPEFLNVGTGINFAAAGNQIFLVYHADQVPGGILPFIGFLIGAGHTHGSKKRIAELTARVGVLEENQAGSPGAGGLKTLASSQTPVLDEFGTDLACGTFDGERGAIVTGKAEGEALAEALLRSDRGVVFLVGGSAGGTRAVAEAAVLVTAAAVSAPGGKGKRIIDVSGVWAVNKNDEHTRKRALFIPDELINS